MGFSSFDFRTLQQPRDARRELEVRVGPILHTAFRKLNMTGQLKFLLVSGCACAMFFYAKKAASSLEAAFFGYLTLVYF
jgi:hypothetical protein